MQAYTHATMAQVPWQSICKARSASWGPCRERTGRPRQLDRCQKGRTCMAHATCLQTPVRQKRVTRAPYVHTLCFRRTAGTGEGCGRVWLGEVPGHVLSIRGAARAPVRRVLFDTHGQIARLPARSVVGWRGAVLARLNRRRRIGALREKRSLVQRGEWEKRTLTTPLLVELKTVTLYTTGGLVLVCVLQARSIGCSHEIISLRVRQRSCKHVSRLVTCASFAMPSSNHVHLSWPNPPEELHLTADERWRFLTLARVRRNLRTCCNMVQRT